ncbi:adipocyte plasma membrane-associated protein isoform X1 [Hemiscyllium ocellatum]|uniref:adipocyte plasma membrane-associated protein isoform X1 n=1 Tax=Hemiscyllium ocellatum TaxID=170820 RepID=UPI00296631A3|nr:adipocyte plasma membrane-associated protein isoform X1 [Hemiscyllium ocellatum]
MKEGEGLRQRRPQQPQVVSDESRDAETKHVSAYSGKVFRITLTTLIVTLLAPLLVATLLLESPINPEPFSYKEPPLLAGPLEPNLKLRQAERLFDGQLIGPESIAHLGEVIFTGTADGQILKISDGQIHTLARIGKLPCGTREDEPTCGRPLGIRVGPNGTLFVADAYYGLFEINPVTGEVEMLVSAQKIIQGRRMAFVNDLSITQDGRKIYFTDSSSKWQRRDNRYLVMEGTADGRLMEYDTVTKQVEVLMDDLRFANGVQLSPAEDYVLVTETTMARIRRYHISGLRKGGHDIFFDNLPGFPDNIRPSSSGGYWIGMAVLRPNPGFSMMDFLAPRPWLKNLIFKLFSQEMTMKFVPKYGLVLELNEDGSINRSFHDPHGVVVPAVSEADEHDGYLYLGSYYSPFLCRLDLNKV